MQSGSMDQQEMTFNWRMKPKNKMFITVLSPQSFTGDGKGKEHTEEFFATLANEPMQPANGEAGQTDTWQFHVESGTEEDKRALFANSHTGSSRQFTSLPNMSEFSFAPASASMSPLPQSHHVMPSAGTSSPTRDPRAGHHRMQQPQQAPHHHQQQQPPLPQEDARQSRRQQFLMQQQQLQQMKLLDTQRQFRPSADQFQASIQQQHPPQPQAQSLSQPQPQSPAQLQHTAHQPPFSSYHSAEPIQQQQAPQSGSQQSPRTSMPFLSKPVGLQAAYQKGLAGTRISPLEKMRSAPGIIEQMRNMQLDRVRQEVRQEVVSVPQQSSGQQQTPVSPNRGLRSTMLRRTSGDLEVYKRGNQGGVLKKKPRPLEKINSAPSGLEVPGWSKRRQSRGLRIETKANDCDLPSFSQMEHKALGRQLSSSALGGRLESPKDRGSSLCAEDKMAISNLLSFKQT